MPESYAEEPGQHPTTCEVSLLQSWLNSEVEKDTLELRADKCRLEKEAIVTEILMTPQPEPVEVSLFGLPGWTTPVLIGVGTALGVGIGLAL